MFTGIIEQLGTVAEVQAAEEQREILVQADLENVVIGESIAVNGICLTVTEIDDGSYYRFYVSPETMDRTSLRHVSKGSLVNIERALTAEMRLSGHLVQGHVDGVATIESITPRADSHRFTYRIPNNLARYCVEKGSIAIDGVSLTVSGIEERSDGYALLSVDIIPHTWEHTNFKERLPGDTVNIEVDILAKYLEKLCKPHMTTSK